MIPCVVSSRASQPVSTRSSQNPQPNSAAHSAVIRLGRTVRAIPDMKSWSKLNDINVWYNSLLAFGMPASCPPNWSLQFGAKFFEFSLRVYRLPAQQESLIRNQQHRNALKPFSALQMKLVWKFKKLKRNSKKGCFRALFSLNGRHLGN